MPTALNSTQGAARGISGGGTWGFCSGERAWSELTALSSPPTTKPVSATSAGLRGLPQSSPRQSPTTSPRLAQPFREPMPPGSSPSPRRKFLALPQAPPCSKFLWQEAREPPWLLIHPTASPRSPQSHWESRGPPCQRPAQAMRVALSAPPGSFPQFSQEVRGGFPRRKI